MMSARGCALGTVVCVYIILQLHHQVDGWSYLDTDEWYKSDPACGNPAQSPINLHPDQSLYQHYTPGLHFINYDHVLGYTEYDINNNGHTVVVSFTYNNKSVSITGGGLPERYALQQFHFHWGSERNKGSEHSINGGYYPMEMHLVHYNATYNEYGAATSVHDGLAVLGVFVQLSEKDNPALEHIVKFLNKVEFGNEHANITEKFSIQDILPSNTEEFYRYEGSLTTPPCYSSVIWTIFRNPITISQRQLNVFRSLHENTLGDEDEILVNNFRPPQPLHDRPVYRTYEIEDDWSYEDTSQWSMLYPMCDGLKQSPIALASSSNCCAQVKTNMDDFAFTGYTKSSSVILNNTGHSVEMHVNPDASRMTVTGGGLPGTYVLYQINFHWGTSKWSGSEHTIDNSAYPLEIQLLHFNSRYGDRMNASQYADGLAAFAVLGQLKENQGQLSIIDDISKAQFSRDSVRLDSFTARSLLPDNTQGYYRYNGSLTTPECTENVIWTVFTSKLSVPSRQLDSLRQCVYITPREATSRISMADRNNRPIQAGNNRPVFHIKPWGSTSSTAAPAACLQLILIVNIVCLLHHQVLSTGLV